MLRPRHDGPATPVEVRRHGAAAPGAPKVLFLHGLAGNDTMWQRAADVLGPGREIWLGRLPWRGQGLADWGRDPDLGGWVEQALLAVPGGPDVVVAHSMTSNVLLELLDQASRAAEDPFARFGVRALVLVAPFYRARPDAFDWATISYYLNDFHLILREGIHVQSRARISPETEIAMAERVREWIGPAGWVRFFDLYLRTPDLQTARITAPCLVIGGARDFAAPPDNATALAGALPDARLRVLADSGHFPMVDEPELFGAELQAFFDSVLVPREALGTRPRPAGPLSTETRRE
ncbi:alpha/beta fold hydrolase [Streptomyces sp. CG1]|uniref:alpha/beta fold hydrolase n=1 Tax=Streptomyces sp. CG1 TaxID=1287523 RepID=UPI0034E1A0AA